MSKEFEGKIALVTGGSSGIGRATAIAFAKKGTKVVIASPQEKEGEETVAMIKEVGSEAIFFKTDITQVIEVENLVNQTINTYSRLLHSTKFSVEKKHSPLLCQGMVHTG